MTAQHQRRVAMCAPNVEVTVEQRGYVAPPVPDRKEEVPLATSADVHALHESLKTVIMEGTKQVVDTLSRPVRPVFDKNGKIVAAQRVPTGD